MSKVVIEKDDMATLEYETAPTGVVFVHLTVHDNVWTKSKYKEWKVKWEEIKEETREIGIDELFTFIPNDDEKLNHFQRMFGFELILAFRSHNLYRQRI